jgi:thiamine biosynthesis lipoprotein
VTLDLNGVVKSKTVDDALAYAGRRWISAGGDIGTKAGDVVAALPAGGAVRVDRGAIATSGTDRRRWLRGGRRQHHLIDPRTGSPSRSPWRYVTASAATCLGADVAAKIGYLRGATGPAWLAERGIAARFVTEAGVEVLNDVWRRSLEAAVACT